MEAGRLQEGECDVGIRTDTWRDKVYGWCGCLLLVCVYRLLLDYIFSNVYVVSKRFSAYSFFAANETWTSFSISWLLLFVSFPFAIMWFKQGNKTFSSIVMFLIYLFSYVPFTVCVRGGTISADCLIWAGAYFFILFGTHCLSMKGGFFEFRVPLQVKRVLACVRQENREKIIILCAALMMLVVIYISYRYTGFRLNFDLQNIYELRLEARKFPLSPLTRFLFSWSKNLLPLFFGYFLLRKRFVLAAIALFAQFLSFSIDGAKYTLFIPVVVALIALLYLKYRDIQFQILVSVGLIGLSLLDIVLHKQSAFLNDNFIRRFVFAPAHLHEWYYQFFVGREADFFRTNLRHFGVEGPYTAVGGVARAIGDFYGSSTMHANNGLFSDAISNLGVPWLLIMPVAVVLVLRLFDSCTMSLDTGLVAIMAVQVALGLISSPLVSLLLAGGLIFFLPLALLMNWKGIGARNNIT